MKLQIQDCNNEAPGLSPHLQTQASPGCSSSHQLSPAQPTQVTFALPLSVDRLVVVAQGWVSDSEEPLSFLEERISWSRPAKLHVLGLFGLWGLLAGTSPTYHMPDTHFPPLFLVIEPQFYSGSKIPS